METSRRTRRFEWCVRFSIYFAMVLELSIMVNAWNNAGTGPPAVIVSLLASVAHIAANIAFVTWSLSRLRESQPARSPWPRWRLGLVILSTAVVIGLSVALYGGGAIPLLAYVAALSWSAFTPLFRFRAVLIGIGVIIVVTAIALITSYDDTPSTIAGLITGLALVMTFIVSGTWLSGWMLRVHLELDRALVDSARLATAEERLRISRDLHDVFGRTLATVALKSELAAELTRRGRTEEATDEMAAVRTLAEEAGREVRSVLRGYRDADLQVELRGAVSLLAAAGITCQVRGVPDDLDPSTASTLAWVTREAVTNLIKHSRASEVTITVTDADPLTMIIENDGVVDRPAGTGSGLLGMAERAQEAGGRLTSERRDDRFVITVELPRSSVVPRG